MKPGDQVYSGMIVGEHSHDNDLEFNICKEKKLTNIRAAGRDENIILTPPRDMSLEKALEWIAEDELVEVTPQSIRLRKKALDQNARYKLERDRKKGGVASAPPVVSAGFSRRKSHAGGSTSAEMKKGQRSLAGPFVLSEPGRSGGPGPARCARLKPAPS